MQEWYLGVGKGFLFKEVSWCLIETNTVEGVLISGVEKWST